MVELAGTLDGIGLPALVRLLGELHETGALRISQAERSAELTFTNGELISAVCGQERGVDALDACALVLASGDFTFVEGAAPADRNVELSADAVRQHLVGLSGGQNGSTPPLPSLESVPRIAQVASPGADQVTVERAALQVLLQVDGRRTVREIVGDRPVMPALRSLSVLAQTGLIELEPLRPQTVAPASSVPAAAATAAMVVGPSAPSPVQPPAISEPVEPAAEGTPIACPNLGFADEPARHYARPTALHRCYASTPASLVSSQEQRELCLGARYATCPRFVPPPADDDEPAAAVPPGVASRLALAHSMSVSAVQHDEVPSWIGADGGAAAKRRRLVPQSLVHRGPLLIAAGAVIGLLFLLGALLTLPMLQPGIVPATPTVAPVFTPAATAAPARPAVAGVTATSPPQPTAVPTAPPRASTPTAALPPNVLVDTRFNSGVTRDWLETLPFGGWRDGAYRLAAQQATKFVAIGAPFKVPDDVLVSATMRKTGGPPGGGYGLIVRNQSPEALNGTNQEFDAYVFEAGDLGEFGIWRREGDHWVDLVPWTRSQAVRQGGSPNDLAVRVIGPQLLLTINGIEVARVDDDVLAHGGVGVFAGGDNNEVALDRFTVQVPN